MNWLAHLALSPPDPEIRAGNVLADWVKRDNRAGYAQAIQRGFALHRVIDQFTDRHPLVARSINRIESPYKRYAAVCVDVFYDHFLAAAWPRFVPQPLDAFVDEVYGQFAALAPVLTPEVNRAFGYMQRDDWLRTYTTVDGVALTLKRMSGRLRPGNLLAESAAELVARYDCLREDFEGFFPELMAEAERWRAEDAAAR
jgi:acyl carrier protein phosphodiesterase